MAAVAVREGGASGAEDDMRVRLGLPSGQVETVRVSVGAPLSTLVTLIREAASLDPEKTRIRLITSGRLLADESALVGALLSDNDFVHCAVSDRLPPRADSPSRRREPGPALVITAGAPGAPGTEVRIVLHDLGPGATARLAEAGFSSTEAANLTSQLRRVRAEVEGGLRGSRQRSLSEPRRSRRLAADAERAVEADSAGAGSSVEGTNTDFLMGCVCGYLLGVLVLALLLDKNITRRWRVGIVAGVATNCAFGILRITVVTNSILVSA